MWKLFYFLSLSLSLVYPRFRAYLYEKGRDRKEKVEGELDTERKKQNSFKQIKQIENKKGEKEREKGWREAQEERNSGEKGKMESKNVEKT